MHFVLLGEHTAEVCPTSNAKTRDLMLEIGPQMPSIAEQAGVSIVAGPFVNREHVVVMVVESDDAEKVDQFLLESRLHQWNTIRILPSHTIEEGMKDVREGTPLW